MTDKADVGGYIYNATLQRGRQRTKSARDALRRIVEENPGPQTLAGLITKAAIALGDIEAVLTELDQLGRTARSLKKGEQA